MPGWFIVFGHREKKSAACIFFDSFNLCFGTYPNKFVLQGKKHVIKVKCL